MVDKSTGSSSLTYIAAGGQAKLTGDNHLTAVWRQSAQTSSMIGTDSDLLAIITYNSLAMCYPTMYAILAAAAKADSTHTIAQFSAALGALQTAVTTAGASAATAAAVLAAAKAVPGWEGLTVPYLSGLLGAVEMQTTLFSSSLSTPSCGFPVVFLWWQYFRKKHADTMVDESTRIDISRI